MTRTLVVILGMAIVTVTSCGNETPSTNQAATIKTPSVIESQPTKDCTYFQELAYELKESASGGHTKIITKDFIERWTYVVINNSKCFTQIEYCDAIDAHNSVSPQGRQESSPYC
jgi:hypothetical protein